MQKAHQNINWENRPSTDTPINETNLNLMDRSIDTIDDRVIAMDVSKANQTDLLQTVKNITYDDSTGVFTVTFFNGTSITIDTDIEKIAINFDYDDDPTSATYQKIIIELEDGTIKYIDLSALITEYEFATSNTIVPTIQSGVVSMEIIDGSVTDQKMQPNYLADITVQANASASAASAANGSKQDSEAWAVGTRNGAPVQYGDPTYQNNAKYYAQHGAGTSFSGLADTDFDNLINGQVPVYDADTQMWRNGTPEAGILPKLVITGEAGSTITILSPSMEQITPTAISATVWSADVKEYGDYLITASKSGSIVQKTVSVNVVQVYNVTMAFFEAFITVTFPNGATVSCSAPDQETQYATTSPYTFTVNASATYTITGTRSGITETQTVVITTSGQTESVTLSILPNGSTVTPTDDVQILLNCADIWDKTSYTTIADLLADDTSLLKVLTSDNAIDYLVRSTTFASAITADEDAMAMIGSYDYASNTLLADSTWATAILNSTYKDSVANVSVPKMTGYTTPSGEVIETGHFDVYNGYLAFDETNTGERDSWAINATSNVYLGYKFVNPRKINAVYIENRNESPSPKAIATFKIQGSNDGTNWTDLTDTISHTKTGATDGDYYLFSNENYYLYYRVYILSSVDASYVGIGILQFYGRENGGVQTWLRSGGITDKDYTTLAEVLADITTLSALIANHDAVDYLVTAYGLIDGITADATAMSYIGLNNYCANSLIADSEWLTAIANSTYFNSVLNLKNPTMTDNTHPSGVASSSTSSYTYNTPYQAFDGNSNTPWGVNISPCWVQYEFTSAVKILYVKQRDFNTTSAQTWNIQASNDNFVSDVNTIATYSSVNDTQWQSHILNNDTAYKYWRLQSPNGYGAMGVYELEFYGRQDV